MKRRNVIKKDLSTGNDLPALQTSTQQEHPAEPVHGEASVESALPSADIAVQLLQLVGRFHAARGDAVAWSAALNDCRVWFNCMDALDNRAKSLIRGPDELEALAGRVTHCAHYKQGACGDHFCDALKRIRCEAVALHLHEAAVTHRAALRAALFEQQTSPTWILDRHGFVLDANNSARSWGCRCTSGRLAVIEGYLVPATGERAAFSRALASLTSDARFTWPDRAGEETSLLLRRLHTGDTIAAILVAPPLSFAELASRFAVCLTLTTRQSELATHLFVGESLSETARKMGISRNTANEHLAALLRHTGATNRTDLQAVLLRAVQALDLESGESRFPHD